MAVSSSTFHVIELQWVYISFNLTVSSLKRNSAIINLLQQIGVVRDMITVCIYYMLKMTISIDHKEISKLNELNLWTLIQINNSGH